MGKKSTSPKTDDDKGPKPLGPPTVIVHTKPIIRPKIESRGR